MKNIGTLLLMMLTFFTSLAQNKKLTIEDATLGLRSYLAPQTIKQLKWIPNEQSFSFVSDSKENPALIQKSVPSLKADTLFTLKDLNQWLSNSKLSESLSTMPSLHWLHSKALYFQKSKAFYLIEKIGNHWELRLWQELPENADNIQIEEKQGYIAYTLDNNLFIINQKGQTTPISNDSRKGIVYGQSVHQNEFGIEKGIFFSPKGNYLAFYRMDETMVKDYPIIDWTEIPAKDNPKKYPMAGTPSHHVTLGVFQPKNNTTVYLKTGFPEEQYLTGVTWSPDEKYILIGLLNRDQNHLKLNKYDAKTGQFLQTLFEERDEKYVQPTKNLIFLPNDNERFVWWSQRSGFRHLYLYNLKGDYLGAITQGDYVVNDILGFHKEKQEIIYASSQESPMSKNIYSVNWMNHHTQLLTKDFGVHQGQLSENGHYLIDQFSNPHTPRKIEIISLKSKWKKTLLEAENPLISYERPTIKNVNLKASDGTELYGKIILPTHFDSTKKYPVIVYLYNGPNVQLLNNGFPASGNLWYEYMAQKGYIVFTMDGRGSSNRGLKFEQAIFRQLGTIEMEDQLKGVEYLKSLAYVDSNRLGVHGWSFGGFMTTSLMLRHPGVFKVAVAGGPVIDWRMYEIMYTERYMDTPESNPEGYASADLLTKTKNLKGKLLMIHGAQDGVVVWQHSMRFIKACVENGVQIDYFVYPGHEHNVLGKDRVHLMQKITDYFDQNL